MAGHSQQFMKQILIVLISHLIRLATTKLVYSIVSVYRILDEKLKWVKHSAPQVPKLLCPDYACMKSKAFSGNVKWSQDSEVFLIRNVREDETWPCQYCPRTKHHQRNGCQETELVHFWGEKNRLIRARVKAIVLLEALIILLVDMLRAREWCYLFIGRVCWKS